ncbi:MAG: helix-turn-helix domain-containing protein [Methylococcaceae bacterium]|nr:helix-turn-helix domain-containing protein [Methylococcaceae bacterium]
MKTIDLRALPAGHMLDTETAAQCLGVQKATLEVWRSTGRYPALRFVKIGRLVRYRAGDLLAFIDGRIMSHTGQMEAA